MKMKGLSLITSHTLPLEKSLQPLSNQNFPMNFIEMAIRVYMKSIVSTFHWGLVSSWLMTNNYSALVVLAVENCFCVSNEKRNYNIEWVSNSQFTICTGPFSEFFDCLDEIIVVHVHSEWFKIELNFLTFSSC